MATVFALEQGLFEAGRHPNPPQYQGKLRIIKGSFTTTATPGPLGSGLITVGNGDVVICGLMHKDEQVLNFGVITFGAFGAGALANIGTYTRVGNVFTAVSTTRYANGIAVNAAGSAAIAASDAQNTLDVQTQDVYIALTATGAAYANGQTFKMAFYYVGD